VIDEKAYKKAVAGAGSATAYLPLLEHSDRPAKVIMNELASNPGLFVQLICAVYAPSDDRGVVDTPPENAEHARNIATQAYRLLRLWTVIPGTMAENSKVAGRDAIAEQKIGEVLSASKIDEDGAWPAAPTTAAGQYANRASELVTDKEWHKSLSVRQRAASSLDCRSANQCSITLRAMLWCVLSM
jgi:hypothetical protein